MFHKQLSLAVVAAAAMVTGASATCNPLEKTTCSDDTALSTTYSYDFTNGEDSDNWSSIGSVDPNYTTSGVEFIITEKGDAPTIQSAWYIFFGRVEVHVKSASGTGIVSTVVLLSDDEDEIDWEWLGGDADEVQTNYFSQGNTSDSTDREVDATVDDAQSTSHNYTIDWTEESLKWYIDGSLVRTLEYSTEYPQTPSLVKLGIWAGGDSDNAEGTIEWAGGETDYDDGPFTMTVESIKVTNYNPGSSYSYSDQTGLYSSIEVNDSDDDSSSSSTTSGTETTGTSTLNTKTAAASGSSDATTVATATASASADSTPLADTTDSSSSSNDSSTTTPASSTPSATSSTSLGEHVSPSVWVILGGAAVALFGFF